MGEHLYQELGPRCPYCNHSHYPDEPFYWDEDTTEMECEHCGKEFGLQVHTSTSWSSFTKDAPHDR